MMTSARKSVPELLAPTRAVGQATVRRVFWVTLGFACVSTPVLAGSSVTGRLTWGEGGAVRVVVALPNKLRAARGEIVWAEVINEGSLVTTLDPRARWLAVMDAGDVVELQTESGAATGDGGARAIEPLAVQAIRLVFTRKTKAAVVGYRLRSEGRPDLEIGAAWSPAHVRSAVAPPHIGVVRQGGDWVESVLAIDSEGRVSRAEPRSGGAAQRAAALSTLMRWTYEPAREGGMPVASVRREVLQFTGGYTSRLTLASPPEACAPRIRAALIEKYPRVVLHPDGNGLVIVGEPREGLDFREVRFDLVRWGPEPDGRGTWVATASRSLIEYRGLDCEFWEDHRDSAEELGLELSAAVGIAPSTRDALVSGSPGSIPSGVPEAPGLAEWGDARLRRFAAGAIARAGSDEPFRTTWGALPQSEISPPVIMAAVVPPRRTRSVEPNWAGGPQGGRVVMRGVISKHGNVTELWLLEPGAPDMNRAAREAACRWRYEPAKLDGVPVSVYFTVIINFNP